MAQTASLRSAESFRGPYHYADIGAGEILSSAEIAMIAGVPYAAFAMGF
jgi:hypothetical protein